MHLACAIRGDSWHVQRFLNEIQSKYVNYGNEGVCNIVWRPYLLGEFIFPESSLQNVLNTFEPMNWKREKIGFEILRKGLGMEKVPKADGKTLPLPVWNHNFEMKLIGIKKDKFVDGKEKI